MFSQKRNFSQLNLIFILLGWKWRENTHSERIDLIIMLESCQIFYFHTLCQAGCPVEGWTTRRRLFRRSSAVRVSRAQSARLWALWPRNIICRRARWSYSASLGTQHRHWDPLGSDFRYFFGFGHFRSVRSWKHNCRLRAPLNFHQVPPRVPPILMLPTPTASTP